MSIDRVAVVFDNQTRPETTGIYCLRALSELTQAVHVTPDRLPEIKPGQFDLILNIDDGLRYVLPSQLHPCAWWVIDTHLAPEWAEEKGQAFDWRFAAQLDGAERLCRHGLPTAWLPLACDPDIHRPHSIPKKWDVGFVGRIASGARQDLLSLIRHHFANCFIGQAYFDEFARVYSASRIGFNRSIRNDVNMRVFETLGCGAMLLTNDLSENGQEQLLKPGVHLGTYRDPEELLDKLKFFLSHDHARETIARAGLQEAIAKHTYRHRMQTLLQSVERDMNKTSIGGCDPFEAGKPLDSDWLDEIDVVVKTFLRPLALLRLLKSLFEFYPTARVTVADDGRIHQGADSDSRLCSEFLANHPQVTVIELPFAAGVVVGRNTLVEQTRRPYLLLLDDDFCFTENTRVEQLFERLRADLEVGAVAGVCIDVIDDHRQRRSSGGILKIDGDTLVHDTQGWHDRQRGLCDYVPNFMLLRREIFAAVRWDIGLGGEHYDFLLQLFTSKWRVLQVETVQIDHYPLTASLPGYGNYRHATKEPQQAFLRKWNLKRMLQDGKVILESASESMMDANNSANQLKDDFYFEFPRPDVLELVPLEARRILDIGCGSGVLGAQIRRRQSAVVIGMELNGRAAESARQRLDEVIEQNVEQSNVDFPSGSFDCVICADVLEHLREPGLVLKKIRNWLTPNGRLVISIPNVRHHTVVNGLLAGNWTYEAAGLLDADHVRFFTRREIEKLLYRQGFTLVELRPKPSADYAEWIKQGRPDEVRLGSLQIAGLIAADAEEFYVYQYLLVAQPDRNVRLGRQLVPAGTSPEESHPGLTSIILVTFNQVAFTRECVDSIRMRTDEPYELICIDNGSTDGTAGYLRSLAGAHVILNSDNRGFPRAVNQGMAVARGKQILLLNNDTVVTTGWLRRMLNALHSSPQIGLVGPCSNFVGGPQQVPVTYQGMGSLDGFAWDWGQRYSGQIQDLDRLVGFCLLIKREVLDRVGVLDERFGIGCFEDDDYCRRALRAGYRCVVAADSFVHHYGHQTFKSSGVDLQQVLIENQRKFDEKWNAEVQSSKPSEIKPESSTRTIQSQADYRFDQQLVFSPKAPAAPRVRRAVGGGLLLTEDPIRLSLCMIVRDNEQTIEPCLKSIQPWVDEIVVVDTGSRDRTPEICRYYGARVFEFPWIDDFSAARNVSLEYARGQWIFWMDSDDTISEQCGRQLRELADGPHANNLLGYVMQVHCPGPSENGQADVTVVDHIKLFPNHPQLRFEHRIHEQILPAIRRLGGEVQFTDIHVVHSGSDHSISGRERKLERDFRLLRLDLDERPDHPFVLFNLGMTHADAQNHVKAVQCLNRCIEVSSPEESHVAKTYTLLVSSLQHLDEVESAWKICQQGCELFPEDKELLFRKAMLAHQSNRLSDAVELYERVLAPSQSRQFASVDADLAGYKARHNLALVYEDMSLFEKAEDQWQIIARHDPANLTSQIALIECLIKQHRLGEARVKIKALAQIEATSEGFRLAAKCAEMEENLSEALAILDAGLRTCGESRELLRETARLQYNRGDLIAASATLRRLSERAPQEQSVWNNLGVVLSELQQRQEASAAFQKAAELSHSRKAHRLQESM